jgi:NADP-dependent 3-hydroxy acid dehydrogenase YdfG
MMKRVVVTGGSEGLGAAFGQLCTQYGTEVICLSRKAPTTYTAHHIAVDLTDPEAIEQAAKAIEAVGPFDALVHCAGMLTVESPDAIDYARLEQLFHINVLAPIYLTSCLFSAIKANKADVMNVGSTTGTKAYKDQCAYGASKWAVRGISQNWALEFMGTPCRVIQFNPGGFKSQIFAKATGETKPLDGFMEPDDLAKLMLFVLELPKSVEVSEMTVNRHFPVE